jgi:hypothetical protein
MYADAYYPPKSGNEAFLLRTINMSTGEQEECWMNVMQYNKGWNEIYLNKQSVVMKQHAVFGIAASTFANNNLFQSRSKVYTFKLPFSVPFK